MKIARCNRIEGFRPEQPESGLYLRSVVTCESQPPHGEPPTSPQPAAEPTAPTAGAAGVQADPQASSVAAFIYHQKNGPHDDGIEPMHFVEGDWLAARRGGLT